MENKNYNLQEDGLKNVMKREWDGKKFTKYIIWTFLIAWILQVLGSICANKGIQIGFTLILSVSMFVPLLGAALAKAPLRDIGWKPQLKGNVRYILAAWFAPVVFTILGAVLYFAIFPSRFDLSGSALVASYGAELVEQLRAAGLTVPIYFAVAAIQAITYAPWMNMLFALGEEVGWRGVMYPMLKKRLGKTKGRIIGGIIWGTWHWPVMILAGYEYGKEYWGAPIVGMALFCLVCVVMGTLLDVVYEKTGCIWVPSLAHGAVNAICALPVYMVDAAYMDQKILGPAPIGIISMIPMLIVAVWVLVRDK